MKKAVDFLIKRRIVLFVLTVALAVASAAIIPFVKINYDLTAYLPDGSGMKQGLKILNEQFPPTDEQTFELVFEGLERGEKEEICVRIAGMTGVSGIEYGVDDPMYNKDAYTLFVVKTKLSQGEETDELITSIEKELAEYNVYTYYENTAQSPIGVMRVILPIVFVLVIVILFLLCRSFFQPVLIIVNIGFAIVINMGTNIVFNSVSDITFSISAVMQLILSIDYSVILFNEYTKERELNTDKVQSMKKALLSGSKSIIGSAVTTFVGLISLLFMSFKLGQDMGLVIAKGVIISCLCVFTALPCLILWTDKILMKTDKKPMMRKLWKRRSVRDDDDRLYNALGRIFHTLRYPIIGIAIVFFVLTCVFQSGAKINYSERALEKVRTIFPYEQVVLIYANEDESNIFEAINYLSGCEGVTEVTGYANTVGEGLTYTELAARFGITEDIAEALYYVYENGFVSGKMTIKRFIDYAASEKILCNPMLAKFQTEEIKTALDKFSVMLSYIEEGKEFTATEISEYLDIDEVSVKALFLSKLKKTMTLSDFIGVLLSYPDKIPEDKQDKLYKFKEICDAVISGKPLSAEETANLLPVTSDYINPTTVKLVYVIKAAENANVEGDKIALYDIISFLYEKGTSEPFAGLVDEEIKGNLAEWKTLADGGKEMLVGEEYSRLVITLNYPSESDELYTFYRDAEGYLGENLRGKAYFVGESAMSYELAESFPKEYLLISVLIAAIVFVIVCFTLKKVSFAAGIVGLIQSAVFFMMSFMAFIHSPIHYVAVIIVQCVLMGAMVDYGIIMALGFQRARKTQSVQGAAGTAFKESARTVLISSLTVTAASFTLGLTISGAVGSILISLGIGTIAATVLMFTVMPAVLAIFDNFPQKKTDICPPTRPKE